MQHLEAWQIQSDRTSSVKKAQHLCHVKLLIPLCSEASVRAEVHYPATEIGTSESLQEEMSCVGTPGETVAILGHLAVIHETMLVSARGICPFS